VARPRVYDESTRSELVHAAGRLLAERGPSALSVRAVADTVGASTRAIYGLFGSKAELVRGMHVAGFASLDHHLAAVPTTDDPLHDLVELGLAYRASALAEPHLYDVMFGRPFPEFVPDHEDAALALGTLEVLRDAVRRARDAAALPHHLDVEDVTLSLWARVHGLASLELGGALGDRGERYWRAVLEMDQVGLRTSGITSPG
jgi:AcrR family transcriptional regulator